MIPDSLKKKVRLFVAENSTGDAVKALLDWASGEDNGSLLNAIVMLSGEWKAFEKDKAQEIISDSEEVLRYNQLNKRVLDMLHWEADAGNAEGNIVINKTITVPKDFKGGIFQNVIGPPTFVDAVVEDEQSPVIYFSYAWNSPYETTSNLELVVDELYDSLKADGFEVRRDKEDLAYKSLISDFMKAIGKGDFVVVAISDKYLKSENCMFEFYELYRNAKMDKSLLLEKIYPVCIEHISLNKPATLATYFQYWLEKEKEWEALITAFGTRISEEQQAQYRTVKQIANDLGAFLAFLSDVNSKSTEQLTKDNFEVIKKQIMARAKGT